MMNERLRSIMTRDVVIVSSTDTLDKVKTLLFEKHFHHIPVVDDGKLVGIVTSWDLIKLNLKFEEYGGLKVTDVMTRKVASLGPNELIGAAAMIFLKHLFHGLPIVEDDGTLVGIVTTHDILKYTFQREYPHDIFVEETHWIE